MVSKFSILCKLYLLKKIFQPLVAQYVNGYYWTMQTYLISHLYVWGRIIARAKCSMSIVINSSSPWDNLLKKWIKKLRHGRIRQVAIPISCRTSWRNESSNVSLVTLDKLLYYSQNLFFSKIRKIKTDRQDLPIKSPRQRLKMLEVFFDPSVTLCY